MAKGGSIGSFQPSVKPVRPCIPSKGSKCLARRHGRLELVLAGVKTTAVIKIHAHHERGDEAEENASNDQGYFHRAARTVLRPSNTKISCKRRLDEGARSAPIARRLSAASCCSTAILPRRPNARCHSVLPKADVDTSALKGLAITGKARAAIRRATRAQVRKQYAGLGREIVEILLAKHDRKFVDKEVAAAMPRLGHKNLEDSLAAVGRGELAGLDVLRAMGISIDDSQLRESRRKRTSRKSEANEEHSIPVRGVNRTTALKIDARTGAVPGERIVGIVTPGEGITIFPIFAKALEQFDNQPERWVDLAWDAAAAGQRFPARIAVTILNEVGSLAQVTQVIGEHGGNIDALQMVAREGARDFFDLDITVEVHDLKHLNEIMMGLRTKNPVSVVSRVAG